MSAEYHQQEPSEPAASRPKEPFVLAARFPNEAGAGRVYFRVQDAVFKSPPAEVSVFRFQLSAVYHVAALGERPPEALEQRLRHLLSSGELCALPDEILRLLWARRAAASSQGNWVEGHYRPGLHL